MRHRRAASTLVAATVTIVVFAGFVTYLTYSVGSTPSASSSIVRSSPLISFSADAYSVETQALLDGFSASTGIPVAPVKAGGSFADARQIAAGAPDDIFVSVSLAATGPTYLKNLSSNWAIGFASDQIVLAYSNATRSNAAAVSMISSAQQALSTNATGDWNSFLTSLSSGSVKVGISNPVTDPAGLRGWIVLEAAGYLYGGNQQAYVSSILKAKANVTAADAATLVASLQSGQIQFLFTYKSAAIANHLGYLSLDRHVNLSDPNLSDYYSKFSYTDSSGTSAGAPIILAVTIPLSSSHQTEALQFVQYVVKNSKLMSSYGLGVFPQARLYHNVAPPEAIQLMITQGLVVDAGPYH